MDLQIELTGSGISIENASKADRRQDERTPLVFVDSEELSELIAELQKLKPQVELGVRAAASV
jgi:hypothetical protein